MGELLARMRVALRQRMPGAVGEPVFVSRDLQVDLAHRQVLKDHHEVELTPTEYDLLKVLIQNAGKVMTHQQIIKALWSGDYSDASHLLRVNISNLRRKIETDPTRPGHIVTEPGVGYRMRVEA
jgi:two-component system KDP operon response regulator KdpE